METVTRRRTKKKIAEEEPVPFEHPVAPPTATPVSADPAGLTSGLTSSPVSDLIIEGVERLPHETDTEYVRRAEVLLDLKNLSAMDKRALAALDKVLDNDEAPAAVVAAAREILTRTRGKPVDKVEVSGPGGGPIQTAHITEDQVARFIERHAKNKKDNAPDAIGS